MNYTGAGIVVAVVDEGLNTAHPDLLRNYVSIPYATCHSAGRDADVRCVSSFSRLGYRSGSFILNCLGKLCLSFDLNGKGNGEIRGFILTDRNLPLIPILR